MSTTSSWCGPRSTWLTGCTGSSARARPRHPAGHDRNLGEEPPSTNTGRHQYALEDFGLSQSQVHEMFLHYRKKLAINAVFSGLASR